MEQHPSPAAAAAHGFGASSAVVAFVADVEAQRTLARYASTSRDYVALHRTGAPVALYVHTEHVDVAMDLPAAQHVRAVTGARVVGKRTLPYVRVDSTRLHHAGHRALLLQAAVTGVDWTARKTGKTPGTASTSASTSASTALGSAGAAAAPPAACPRCWTVPAANGVCSC